MYTNKLGVEVGCCTRSMSKKGDGKPGDSINSSKSSPIQSKEISPKSKSKDNTEHIIGKIRPSTPRACKKAVSYCSDETDNNHNTNSPGPLTRGKRKSLSVRSSVRNISDYFEKEQPKDCNEINETTDKKVDVEKSGIDKKTTVLSDNSKHITNSSDLTKKKLSCKNILVILRRASEKMLEEYSNLEDDKDDSKQLTNKDKKYSHNTNKESLEDMADNIPRSDDIKKSNNDTAKKSSVDLKLESPSNKDVSENNDPISSLNKKNSPNNSINLEDLNPLINSNLPEKKEKGDEKVVGFEMKKTDKNIEWIDNFKEKSSSFSPKQLDDEKSKINKQIESSTKKTDIEKSTNPIKSPSVKKLESPEKLSSATCTGETSIKNDEKCHLGHKVEKAEILNAVIKIESITRNPIGNEKEEHDSKSQFGDDSDDIISPQEFLKDVFNKTERNLLENKAASRDNDKNENRLSVVREKTKDESKVVENVQEISKSKSSSINIESEESDTKNKTENAIVIVENEKPITVSESATNEKKSYMAKPDIIDKKNEKQLQESGVEKKDSDTVPNECSSTRTHAETQALTKNKRKSIDVTVSVSDVSQNKPTSKSNADTSDFSQQLVVTSITPDNVPETEPSPGKDTAAVETSPQKELKETGETMIEAGNIASISDKKNPNIPSKQPTARYTNETSLVKENKIVSGSCANDLESLERMSESESGKRKNESSIKSPNTSIRIIDLQEDTSMSGVEEIPEVVIRGQKSVLVSVLDNKNKDFSTESNSETISTGASGNEHSEVIDVIDDIPINVNKSRTSGKRSFDDKNDIAGNEDHSLRSFSKKKKVKCTEKEDDEKNTCGEDNEIESLNIGDESIVSNRDVNDEEEADIEQVKDRGGSLDIDDKDVSPTKASLVKPAEEGVEEIVDSDEEDVESSESSDKNIDSRNGDDEPEDDDVEKDSESKGTEDENIALGKAFLDAEAEEGDGNGESSDSESRDIGPQKRILDEAEGENIEKIMVDESSDSDSSNPIAKLFLDDEADEGEEEIDAVMDEKSDESDSRDIVSGNHFLDDEGIKDDNDESDFSDDREILSGKDFLDEEAEEGDEEIKEDTDDARDDTDDDDIISGKYFLEDESDADGEKNYSEEISEEYLKTVKNTVSEVIIPKDKAKNTKEKVKIEKKKVKKIAENRNGNEEVLSNNSGETVSNDEMISLDKSEESERITILKTTISKSEETKSISHLNDRGCWTVSSVKKSGKIKIFNNKICTNNVNFVATDIDSNKKSFGETNLSLNNSLNWIISAVKEDKNITNSKKKPKKLNQLKRSLESITKKESNSVSSSVPPFTKEDELVVQENPDLYDSLLLKRKRSKKKSKESTVKEDNVEELLEYFGSSPTVEGTKSLSMPSTSGKTNESIKNTLASKHSKDLDEQNEEMRTSLKRFSDAIEIYKKKLKVTHNTDKMDKNFLRNTNETPTGVEIKKYPYPITVGNVPESVLPNELKSTFSKVGFNDIVTVSPIMDGVEMKFAVVTFSSRNSQQRALEYYGQLFLKGNPLFPMQCHQDDDIDREERDTRKSNQDPTAELQKYGKAQTKYNKVSKNDNQSKDRSELATDKSGVSQNKNLQQSTNHLFKQKSVIAKNSKSNMNKTDVKELSQKKTNLKNNVVDPSKSKENAAAARKISGNTDFTTKMDRSQCNSVNIKCLGNIRPTIKEVKQGFSVVGVTDVKSINQESKKVTSVEVASKKSVEKLLSFSGKIVINGMPVLIKKNTLQSSLDLPSTSTANLESKKVKKLRRQHNVKTVIDKEQNSDTAAQNRPKDFSLVIKNLPTDSSNNNIRKALLNLGIKGIIKVIIKRDENVNKDKLTGVIKFYNEKFYLNALNTKNILLNGSPVKFITKKDKKD